MDLSHERWEGVTPGEREKIARRLALQLPTGFTSSGVHHYQLGETRRHVALYRNGDATFALIPGGAVTLGYALDRPREPTPDEFKSWQDTASEYGIDKTLWEYIAAVTLRVRRIELAPFLVEATAGEMGWEPLDGDEPEVREIIRKYAGSVETTVVREGVSTRVRWAADGTTSAERSVPQTHGGLAATLAASGFRFPTSDEWEYACGGGAPTLFRWGDHVPCDRYPTDVSPAEAGWRRQWALSGGKLGRPPGGFPSDWEEHRRPNAFGLTIASNPYKSELTAEAGVTRGGDGGCTICGGAGFFLAWLTLATSYFEEESCRYDPAETIDPQFIVGRRVLSL